MLKVQNLNKSYDGLKAVSNCSFSVVKGGITGLIGPNGAGKTTIFDLITGFQLCDSGTVKFNGFIITEIPVHKRVKLGMARTFQNIRVFPEFSSLQNVMLGFPDYPGRLVDSFKSTKKILKKLLEKAQIILHDTGIQNVSGLRARDLSYGQKKLLELARAVATNAELFLLDEPAAGINPTTLKLITNYIRKLNKDGKTFLIVEHNMQFIMEISQKIIVMNFGKEIAIGTPSEIKKNPEVLSAYLGHKHA